MQPRHNSTRYQINRSHAGTESSPQTFWDKIWRDDAGRIVIWQRPNIWLIIWAVCELAAIFISSEGVSEIAWSVGAAALTVWSMLELFRGVNYFRRALGLIVLVMTIASIFKIGL